MNKQNKFDKYGIHDPKPYKESHMSHRDYSHKIRFNKSSFLHVWVKEFLGYEPTVILDVGALDGGDTLAFNSWYPDAQVFSIEGSPHNFDVIKRKLGERENVKVFNYIVSSSDGIGVLQQVQYLASRDIYGGVKHMVMGSIYKLSEEEAKGHAMEPIDSIEVPQITIDTFCEEQGITSIDIMHVDIEGAGYDMLLGMTEVLPKMLFMEKEMDNKFIDKTTSNDDFLRLVKERGYKQVVELRNDYLFILE